jgi:hypothetical protein
MSWYEQNNEQQKCKLDLSVFWFINLHLPIWCVCIFLQSSVLELVDAAIPSKELDPIKQTILLVEGVKVSSRFLFGY